MPVVSEGGGVYDMPQERARQNVLDAYQILLGRDPDPDVVAHYVSRLEAGELSLVEMFREIKSSAEGRWREVDAASVVTQAYEFMLGREPDSGGYDHYVRCLLAGEMTAIDVVRDLASSTEGKTRARRMAIGDAEKAVMDAYLLLLGREPDEEGLTNNVAGLYSGELTVLDMVRNLVQSPEGRIWLGGSDADRPVSSYNHVMTSSGNPRNIVQSLSQFRGIGRQSVAMLSDADEHFIFKSLINSNIS